MSDDFEFVYDVLDGASLDGREGYRTAGSGLATRFYEKGYGPADAEEFVGAVKDKLEQNYGRETVRSFAEYLTLELDRHARGRGNQSIVLRIAWSAPQASGILLALQAWVL